MIRLLLCVIWLILIPTIVGMLITRKMEKYKNSIMLSWILGFMLEFGIFEFLSLPITLVTTSFYPLFYGWSAIIVALVIVSIILNYKRVKEILIANFEYIKKLPIILTIIVAILIGVQTFITFRYMHLDDDDSNFVAKATVTFETNTVYKYDDIGREIVEKDLRHELATYPIYTATISKLIDIHPSITAHTIFPLLFIPMAYLIYIYLGRNIFEEDLKKVFVFMIMLSMLIIYSYYSRSSTATMLLTRIWQGKAMLASVGIPILWLLYLEYSKSERKNIYWISIIIAMCGANLFSSMAVPIMAITLLSLTIAFFIKDRKWSDFLKSAVSVIPCLICGILYLVL